MPSLMFGPANVYAAGYGGVYAFNGTTWTLEQDFTAFGAVPNAAGVPCWPRVVAKQGADLWVCGGQFRAGGGSCPFVARGGVSAKLAAMQFSEGGLAPE